MSKLDVKHSQPAKS